jgi:gliding motility-associated-like protein
LEGKDNIKELFSQKLGNYEAPVNPELWTKISSQVAAGTTATTASTGLSLFAKVAIGLGVSAAAITTVVLLTSSPDDTVSEEPVKEIQVQKETPTSTTTNEKEQVAEVSDENVLITDGFTDVNESEASTSSNEGTSETSSASNSNSQNHTVTHTPNPESHIDLPTRGTTKVIGSTTSEPTIVPGVSNGITTNYSATPTNAPDPDELESTTPIVDPVECKVNVFTPNGDGINDYLHLKCDGLTDFSIVVMNASGDIIYRSEDPAFRWDGRDIRSGNMVESGVYMYMVSANDANGKPLAIYERLTIKR